MLLTCAHCGQTYNPAYMMYCARCGEVVPDARGRKHKPGPADGMGARGGATGRKLMGAKERGRTHSPGVGEEPQQQWQVPRSVADISLEYRNQLNEHPDDHSTRYALGLAYYFTRQWQQAAEQFQQVTDAEPDYADAVVRLALCRRHLRDSRGALEAARRAAALEPHRREHADLVRLLDAEGTP